jgi:hypothetical protein
MRCFVNINHWSAAFFYIVVLPIQQQQTLTHKKMEEQPTRAITIEELDFSRIEFGDVNSKGTVPMCRPLYRYTDDPAEDPTELIIQTPDLPSWWGLSLYKTAKDYSWSVAFDMVGDVAVDFQDKYLKGFQHPLVNAACTVKANAWFPKLKKSERERIVRNNFQPSIPEGLNPGTPARWKVKAKADRDEPAEIRGFYIDPVKRTTANISKKDMEKVFKKGVYRSAVKLNTVYFGGKSWGSSWVLLDLALMKGVPLPKYPKYVSIDPSAAPVIMGSAGFTQTEGYVDPEEVMRDMAEQGEQGE